MKESDGGLRPLFKKNMPGFWQAIETGGTGKGIPDSHFVIDGVVGWIEFKWAESNAIGLRVEQIGWLDRYVRNGGRAYIGVRHNHNGGPRKGPAVDDLYIYSATDVRQISRDGLRSGLHVYCGACLPLDVPAVTSLLTGQFPPVRG